MEVYQGSGICLDARPQSGSERDRDRALTALFLDHYDHLRRTAYVMLGDGALAEEVVMDTFAKALSRWGLVRRAEHPPAYLRQMVVNLCRSKIRRTVLERKVGETFKKEAEADLRTPSEIPAVDHEVWNAVRKLPGRQRACIVLRYLDDLSEPEIAEILDCPVGTVKSQLSRARRKLGEWLGPSIYFEEGT